MKNKKQDAECKDSNCPFHGSLKLRGRKFSGEIIKSEMRRTANFILQRSFFLKKFQRYEKRFTKIKVHNPDCISAKAGDKVKISECRRLSKTKRFVIVEKE